MKLTDRMRKLIIILLCMEMGELLFGCAADGEQTVVDNTINKDWTVTQEIETEVPLLPDPHSTVTKRITSVTLEDGTIIEVNREADDETH